SGKTEGCMVRGILVCCVLLAGFLAQADARPWFKFKKRWIQTEPVAVSSAESPTPTPGAWEQLEWERTTLRQRLKSAISFNFKDTSFHQLIEDLRRLTMVNIVFDKKALDDARINLDQPMSIQVENLSFKSALKFVLKQFGLAFVIENNEVLITTEAKALKQI